ncbi:MAG: hypothetical protein PHV68_05005 [Candidatus Gastranaerophilales bacterium]|nr:hypothetical protein [Candidatus Gastranaerophilales bacterium]
MDSYLSLAPAIVAILLFIFQLRLFVTPEILEKKHRQILDDAEKKFATLHMLNSLKDRFDDMKVKIDKIYDVLIK